ncbi:hypothetical protein OQJ46_03795 [Microbulbifer thermotolerans]|uniref:Uncharacterized protein n=1 Tax=Microbulbifer thermotolerans TaxID=252514 RepID=A0AB35HXD4_MICTH|nr:hypothetical protein [Microbulbifer thermotolerans]MCX2781009.1 hypothetical protein [Microbulbifer thermotolerans]MCX2782112.1 hypothetical protein [Microbulbifer thermotolerans]MCX2796085.1 hypothetical protein [Microbulbifer thermotolerans]MCX2801227.1 hypothetical protein [Microbulbifer thermotolerans]MCX2804596.1 hypothetical protein [Microbulbifer thermotolerans]
MDFNSQISNWLVAVLGGLASWVVIAACALLAINVFFRVRLLHARGDGMHWLLDRSLVIRFLCLLFFIWVLIGFNSNAPKLTLAPDYSAEQQAIKNALNEETGGVRDLSPRRETAAETSERLQSLREAQKEEAVGEE